MLFWRKKNWEDEYDDYYAQDRGVTDGKPRTRTRYLAHLLLLGLVAGLVLAGVGLVSGRTMVEKLITSLITPVGVIWIVLTLMVYFSLLNRRGWTAIASFACWLILTITGNQIVANSLAIQLESDYQSINPYDGDPFELVIVLGGGTNTTISGQSQLAMNGDRVAVAARMYHGGQAKMIVCTGSQTYRSTPLDLHPREEAINILVGFGVPRESLLEMKGNNTSEEMQNLKTWLAENRVDGRIGVITSAWHLSRAMRLASANGLNVEPIPANFISEPYAPNPNVIVPSADNLLITARVCKEMLAGFVGR
ncbi:MAG: YdcF family protein [Planctomycetota bacterium]